MNTNQLKSFAREARIQLMDAAATQLIYWGFSPKGTVEQELTTTSGGYIFRGQAYDGTEIPASWKRLRQKVTTGKEGFTDAAEEAAYTWFNRLTAIKILEENQFIQPTLAYANGSTTPQILQNAKAGSYPISNPQLRNRLQEALLDANENMAFGILITHFCNEHALLKQVFGGINDYTEMLLPQNLLSPGGFIEQLNDTDYIAKEDYQEVELIGWLYQFYIADRKDEVFAGFKKNKKARAEDIPAATQIFTPKWIVSYMVENTLGKIYLDFEEDSSLKGRMKYLVESSETENKNDLIDDIKKLTLIDPACGSGHILVTAFEWLFHMYREQGYSAENAVKNILQHNLYGLEIDNRAMQLSRFALLLKAALMLKESPNGNRHALELINKPGELLPNIYAFPESRSFISEDIAALTDGKHTAEIYKAFDLLRQGKNLGSVIKLDLTEEAIETLQNSYTEWQEKATNRQSVDLFSFEEWEKLKEYFEVAITLSKKYSAVVANPPYMGRRSMNGELKDYLDANYPLTRPDLFSVFMEVCLNLNSKTGLIGMINQHSWMFLSSFENYRKHLLKNNNIQSMLHLGPRTFEELSGEVVQSAAFVLENRHSEGTKGNYYRLVDYKSNKEKEENFLADNHFYPNIPQSNFEKIPGSPIAYWASKKVIKIFDFQRLNDFGEIITGMTTGSNSTFLRQWNEVNILNINFSMQKIEQFEKSRIWLPYIKGGEFRRWYGNHENVVNWARKDEFNRSKTTLKHLYFKEGFTWSFITANYFNARYMPKGFLWDVAGSPAMFDTNNKNKAILGYVNSKVAQKIFKIYNPTINYQSIDVQNLPFTSEILDERIEKQVDINISISKTDWDSRETSWDFEKSPLLAQQAISLQESFSEWQKQVTTDFYKLHANEEELNRIFIDIYGLQEELTPDVPLRDITILQDELKGDDLDAIEDAFRAGEQPELPIQRDIVIQQLISYFVGTMMGRYRLDKPGLHIAHPNPSEEEIAPYNVADYATPFTMQIDEDAILPLMGKAGAFPDDAVERVKDLVFNIWGEDTQVENMNFINEYLGMDLDKWMTEKFWAEHISSRMYKKKPIYWLFCSNQRLPHRSAFRVLVYMHRMNEFTVQNILLKYLHPHISHLKSKYDDLFKRQAELTSTEAGELDTLQKQISELNEYEEQLKIVANQQISFDLDDGVSVNYAKFEGVVAKM